MPIIKSGQEVPDLWRRIGEEESIPQSGAIILSLDRWRRDGGQLKSRGNLGIILRSDQPPALIGDHLRFFSLIQLEFPKFGDGRAYSYARILREQLGYKGELRASGNILRDQYIFMLRCGFDSVEIAEKERVPGFAEALKEFSVFYQPASDDRKPAWQIRHQL